MHSILISLSSLSTSSQHCRLTIWKQLVELTISIWWQDPNNLTYTGTRILDLVYSELLLSTKNQAKTPKSLCILCPRVLPYLSCFERLHNHILFLCPHLCSPLLTIECAKSDPKSSLWSLDPYGVWPVAPADNARTLQNMQQAKFATMQCIAMPAVYRGINNKVFNH